MNDSMDLPVADRHVPCPAPGDWTAEIGPKLWALIGGLLVVGWTMSDCEQRLSAMVPQGLQRIGLRDARHAGTSEATMAMVITTTVPPPKTITSRAPTP